MSSDSPDPKLVTHLLGRLNDGDSEASGELLSVIYDDLHRVAGQVFGSQREGHTLQATALVHEAYIRILGRGKEDPSWQGRRHILAVAAKAMRHVLVDHARIARSLKRDKARVTLSDSASESGTQYDLIDLSDALEELAKTSERISKVVELRILGGLTTDEVAEELQVSRRTVQVDWRAGRAWFRNQLAKRDDPS